MVPLFVRDTSPLLYKTSVPPSPTIDPLLITAPEVLLICRLLFAASDTVTPTLIVSGPVVQITPVASQLVAYGEVRYPFLGISYGMVTPEIVEAEKLTVKQGAFVSGVTDGGPAQAAGILPGDVILTLNGVRLGETDSLRGVLLRYNPGDTVTLTVLRGTEEKQFSITLAVRPPR
jgi:S1-C subfamily serine protease